MARVKPTTSTVIFIGMALVPAFFILLSFILPYVAAIRDGLPVVVNILGEASTRRIVGFTLGQALMSTLLALAIGLPGAWLLGSGRYRGAVWVRAIVSIPFAMPPLLVVLGFVLFFGQNGWANRFLMALGSTSIKPLDILYRPRAIIFAHAFYNFPIVLRFVGEGISRARTAYAHAASSLGASGLRSFLTVFLPLSLPSVAASAILVFLYCYTSFAVVLVLGGGPGATTLPVEIYRATRISLDFPRAGALALIETSLAFMAYALYVRMAAFSSSLSGTVDRTEQVEVRSMHRGHKMETAPFSHPIILIYTIMILMLVLGPLLSVFLESFLVRTRQSSIPTLSSRWWKEISTSAVPALGRSVLLSFSAATISVCMAGSSALAVWGIRSFPKKKSGAGGKRISSWFGARRSLSSGRRPFVERALAVMCAAPLASSGIVLGLGYLRFFGSGLGRSFWAPAFAHAISALPFAYGSISEGLASLPSSLAGASSLLGAQPFRTAISVTLPAAKRRILSAWAFAVAISLGEMNTVLMLGLEDFETLPLLIYRASGAYRFGSACAAGVLLASVCVASYALSEFADRPIKQGIGK